MSGNCKSCGKQNNQCGCSGVYREPHYQGHGHSSNQGQVHNHYYGEKPEYTHPGECHEPVEECAPVYKTTGPARPLTYGNFQVRDGCGVIKPFAWVLVTFTNTSTKAPVWSHPSKEDKYVLSNPVQTNYNGEAQIYFAGGPVDVTTFCDDNGVQGTEVINRFTNFGGFVDDDFRVDQIPVQNCPDGVEEPLIKVNDGANCNIPAIFMTPKYLKIMLNIANNEVAGYYLDVKEYFECLGEPLPDGIKVFGSCDDCPAVYIYTAGTCDQECPPDPCSVEFDNDGVSPCWKKCVDESFCDSITDDPADATHAIDCINGETVRRPISDPDIPEQKMAFMMFFGETLSGSGARITPLTILEEHDPDSLISLSGNTITFAVDGYVFVTQHVAAKNNTTGWFEGRMLFSNYPDDPEHHPNTEFTATSGNQSATVAFVDANHRFVQAGTTLRFQAFSATNMDIYVGEGNLTFIAE